MNYTSRWTCPILYFTRYKHHMAYAMKLVLTHTKKVHEKELKARNSMQKCGANVHHSLANMFLMYICGVRMYVRVRSDLILLREPQVFIGFHPLYVSWQFWDRYWRVTGHACQSHHTNTKISSHSENTTCYWIKCSEQCERMLVISSIF